VGANDNKYEKVLDVSGGMFADMKLLKEKKAIEELFVRVAAEDNRACFGLKDTMRAFEQGAVQTMILWEDLVAFRLELKDTTLGDDQPIIVAYVTAEDRKSSQRLLKKTGGREILRENPLIDWVSDNMALLGGGGSGVQLVSLSSGVGKQFVETFDGIGALLSYPLIQLNLSDSGGSALKDQDGDDHDDIWPFDD